MTDLTDKWKKGELPYGTYYVELNDGNVIMMGYGKFAGWYNVKEVFAPVPTFDELQNINKSVNDLMSANIKLVEENTKLKELLKECREILDYAKDFAYHDPCCKCITKINQALGEDK